jgi:hypothetical protein
VSDQDGLDLQLLGLRSNAIWMSNLRAWHFEQRNLVLACLSVTFQPRMLASDFGRISRSCLHCRHVTQIT